MRAELEEGDNKGENVAAAVEGQGMEVIGRGKGWG